MSGALDVTMEFDTELLRRNRFCIGVKRGNEYRCGSEANEDAKSKAVELLAEAVGECDAGGCGKHGGSRRQWMSG